MAGPIKKNRLVSVEQEACDSDNSADSDDGEMDDDEEEVVEQELQVEFEAHAPSGGDFDGIKRLLRQLFLKAHIDVSALADIFMQQNYLGSVIKQSEIEDPDSENSDDDEDILFGMTSVLNVTTKVQEHDCVSQVRQWILDACQKHGTDETLCLFKGVLDKPRNTPEHTGLIISERLVNIPAQIAAPLFESLSQEIETANEKNKNYNFEHYLMICKLYKMEVTNGKTISEAWVYPKPEEQFFCEEALATIEYCIQDESDTALDGDWDADEEGMKPYRRILLIDAAKLPSIVAKVRTNFSSQTE